MKEGEERIGGEEVVGGESKTLQLEKTTCIWLSHSLSPSQALRDLCHHT